MHQARVLHTLDSQNAAHFARGLCMALGWKKSMTLPIPEDLASFLRKKQQLSCDWKKTTTGKVKLFSLEQLRIGRVHAAPKGINDPNRRREGVYRIPAISLTAKCEKYDPEHLLTFLLFEGLYATLDCDHGVVTVFTKASWIDIVSNPLPYINANWEAKPSIATSRKSQWHLRYDFFKDAFE